MELEVESRHKDDVEGKLQLGYIVWEKKLFSIRKETILCKGGNGDLSIFFQINQPMIFMAPNIN